MAAAWFTTAPVLAQESCGVDDPPPVPVCSVEGMLEAVNPAHTLDVFGNLNPAAFAGGANQALIPGQASMTLSGGVNAGGAACARHLAAHRSGGTEGVPGIDPGTAEMLGDMMGEDLDIPAASGGTRRAIFEVFSPNVISFQSGGLGKPLSLRHGGVGGWPRNSGAHLVIALTEAGPGDLEAGGTYSARAVGSAGSGDPAALYSAWSGMIRPRPYTPPRTEKQRKEQEFEKRMCRTLRRQFLDTLRQSSVRLDATVGRAVRELDCNMDGVGQAGTRTRVRGGALSGTVAIERITDSAVIGSFELSGSTRVERERRTWSRRGPGRVDIDSERDEESIVISGRFAAPNMRNSGYARPPLEIAQAAKSEGGTSRELDLVDFRPRRNAKNLPWQDPGIRLTFNRPLDPLSVVPGAVKVETGLADGQGGATMAPVHVRLRLAGPETVIVTPREDLRDGVRYRVTVPAGGLRGAEGAQMPVDRVWGFETMVNLDDRQPVPDGLAEHLAQIEGVESDTIQVATNAPIVRDKPAVIRVYAKWAPEPQIAPAWQVRSFPAHVRARRGARPDGRLLTEELENVTIRRPDDYTPRERREARNSINLYGWSPVYRAVKTVRTEVEPVTPCEVAPKVFSGEEEIEWDSLNRDLRIGYVFARVGPWFERIPRDMQREGKRAAQGAETFIEQLFPVQSVEVIAAPKIPPDPGLNTAVTQAIDRIAKGDGGQIDRGDVRAHILENIQRRLQAAGSYGSFDLIVIYLPYEWIKLLGVQSYIGTEVADDVMFFDTEPYIGVSLTQADEGKRRISNSAVITHEVGHAFGLTHVPNVPKDQPAKPYCLRHTNTRWDGIEGMRMARDGMHGWNKSHEDGNAEADRELLPLMFPCTRVKERLFITQDNYAALLENLKKGRAALSP